MKKIALAAATALMLAGLAQPSWASDTNPNLAKLNAMFDMLRQQGKLPSQTLTEAPADSYAGPDAAKLKEIARKEYAANFPAEEVLDVRIQMDDWERTAEKRWHDVNKAYYTVDISTIQALVFVRKDAKTAYIFPVDFTKDHTDNDDLTWDVSSSRSVSVLVQEVALAKM